MGIVEPVGGITAGVANRNAVLNYGVRDAPQ